MRFSDYLAKSFLAGLDKSLPVLYGLGYIFVVVPALPEREFGLLGLVEVVFYFILTVESGLVQTPMAKFIAETASSGWAIPSGFLLSSIVLSSLGVASYAFGGLLSSLFNAPELTGILWCVPLLLASSYLKNLTSQICIARHWTGRLVVIDAMYFLGSLAIVVYWGRAGVLSAATHVLLANIFTACAASLLGVLFTRQVLWETTWKIHRHDLRRFLAFGKYSFGANMGAYINGQLDVILIAHFYGPLHVALYRVGKMIYRLYNTFSQALQVILLPIVSRLDASGQKDQLRVLYEKSMFFSYLVLIPLNCGLLLGADWIFFQLYGGRYQESIPLFRWLVAGTFFLPFGAIGGNILVGTGNPKLSFRTTWIVVCTYVITSLVLIRAMGIDGAAMATVIAAAAGAIVTTHYVKTLCSFTLRGILGRYSDALSFAKGLARGKQ